MEVSTLKVLPANRSWCFTLESLHQLELIDVWADKDVQDQNVNLCSVTVFAA